MPVDAARRGPAVPGRWPAAGRECGRARGRRTVPLIAVWAVSSHGGNHHYAQRGKASFLISAVAAAVIAAAPAAVNFFEGIGHAIH